MHPATLYGFILSAIALVGTIVLVALGDVDASVGVPVIVGLGGAGVGVAGAIATPRTISTPVDTGAVGYASADV